MIQLNDEKKATYIDKRHQVSIGGTAADVHQLICIGSSTGGPKALQSVISGLPAELPAPVLIVQHMPPHFTFTLATRLDQLAKIRVKEAEDGDLLTNGTVYIAPGGRHMTVERTDNLLYIRLNHSAPVKGLRPCYDVLLDSLCTLTLPIVYCVLTGMGSDGTIGLKRIKNTLNVYAIAESKETAVIYGMPKAAVETGLIDESVPIEGIAAAISDHLYLRRG